GVMGKPDVEKRQPVAELQRFCRAKRKRALRGRNHAEGYPGGLIETMNGGVRARSCAAQPPSDRKTPCRGKNSAAPSARSARHSSPQNGGPKGKMIEGRSGGSGRGTRRELWAPPDRFCSRTAAAVVLRTDPDPSRPPRPPRISLRPPPLRHRLRSEGREFESLRRPHIVRNALILMILILCVFRDAESAREYMERRSQFPLKQA